MLVVVVIRVKSAHRCLFTDAYGRICNLTQIYSTLIAHQSGKLEEKDEVQGNTKNQDNSP